ncbi:MAG TPA: DUF4384 domain-containing protein [Polyangiaceae bacterium]|jgi:hypothetical protein|nr:DUF4384 domain-containing protein [Polyangiaceae bacterium]
MLSTNPVERPPGCVSDLAFDEWHADELDAHAASELEGHIETCARCSDRKRELEEGARAFLESFPTLSPRTEEPSRRRGAHRFDARVMAVVASLTAAAAVVLFAVRHEDGGVTRSKGGPHIGFYVKRGERVFEGGPGEKVREGDRLRFVVTTTEARHLVVLSLDAKHVASIYYPAMSASTSESVGPARNYALGSGVELDDTLGEETVYALFCDQPVVVETARARLQKERTLGESPGCVVDSFTIVKER